MFGRDQPKHWVRWRLITIQTDQLSLREPVLVMLHELLLQLPVVFGLVWGAVLLQVPGLAVSHLKLTQSSHSSHCTAALSYSK